MTAQEPDLIRLKPRGRREELWRRQRTLGSITTMPSL